VIDAVVAALGIPPDTLVIAPPGSVLKTSSGKIRRSATRDAYLGGRLGRPRRSVRAQWARLALGGLRSRLAGLFGHAGQLLFAAYVGGLLMLTLPPLWGLLSVVPAGRAADRLVRLWCRWILILGGCRLSVDGLEHLRGMGPAVLAANHTSYLDVVALLAAIPIEFRFVAKQELRAAPLIGTVIQKAGHVVVERVDVSRSVADAERVARLLQEGATFLIFPEGTFMRAPGLLPFRLGAFRAAVDAGRPVIPVALRGTRRILPADTWLPRPGPIRVTIAAPITPPSAGGWREVVQLRDRVRAEIALHLDEEDVPAGVTSRVR
jgi:1-acyl-sn-glycerol-3-phosphate acyltransferase